MWKWWPELLIMSAIVVGFTGLCFAPLKDGWSEFGFLDVPMVVKVVDKNTQRPIANASVRVLSDEGALADGQAADQTKEDGQVTLIPQLTSISRKTNGSKNGGIRFWDKRIEVKVDGYLSIEDKLSKYAGDGISFNDLPPPLITIDVSKVLQAKE